MCVNVRQRFRQGAEVTADSMADEVGGVYVRWYPHSTLRNRLVQCARERRTDDPAVRRNFEIKEAMKPALQAILTTAGFAVRPSQNDDDPDALHVIDGPA